MHETLHNVLLCLRSDKVKERTTGLDLLRSFFGNKVLLTKVDLAGDGKVWLMVYQGLFTAVVSEMSTAFKSSKSSGGGSATAALRRLGDTASTVRWVVELSVHLFNKEVLVSVVKHLTQVLVRKGQLLAEVAPDYTKALRCICSYPPHLDHMSKAMWLDLTEMSFNIVLGDPIRSTFQDEATLHASEDEDEDEDERGMDVEDEDEDEDSETTSSVAGTRAKRTRRHSNASSQATSTSPQITRPSATKRRSAKRVTVEQYECMALIAILIRCPSAPLLNPDTLTGTAILSRLQRFLEIFPTESSSLHHDYVLALAATLSHLALNRVYAIQKFARTAWSGLLSLWSTRNPALKEILVGIIITLFPYYVAALPSTEKQQQPTSNLRLTVEGVAMLWDILEADVESPNRKGSEMILEMDSLRLELNVASIRIERPFIRSTFRAGWHFDESQALTWAVLEMHASCAAKAGLTLT